MYVRIMKKRLATLALKAVRNGALLVSGWKASRSKRLMKSAENTADRWTLSKSAVRCSLSRQPTKFRNNGDDFQKCGIEKSSVSEVDSSNVDRRVTTWSIKIINVDDFGDSFFVGGNGFRVSCVCYARRETLRIRVTVSRANKIRKKKNERKVWKGAIFQKDGEKITRTFAPFKLERFFKKVSNLRERTGWN